MGVEFCFLQPRDALEERAGIDDFGGGDVVVFVVGFEEKLAFGFEHPVQAGKVFRINEAVVLVALFRPRIGEEEVDAGGALLGQQPAEGITAFHAKDAKIGEVPPLGFAANFIHPAEEAFDAKEISFLKMGGHFHEERAVAAADVHFERAVGFWEDFFGFKMAKVVGRDEFHVGAEWAGGIFGEFLLAFSESLVKGFTMTKETCLETFFGPDGKTMIIPMDHGTIVPVPGLGNGREIIAELRDFADGFILNLGLASVASDELEDKAVCLRTDCGNTFIPKEGPYEPSGAYRLFGVETAYGVGATAVMNMLFPGAQNEAAIIADCAALVEEGREAEMPVMLETLPYGLGRGDAYTPENIRFAVRLAAELGADVVKTAYPGDKEAFRSIVAECYVPVIVLGGAVATDAPGILQMVRDAMDCGAAGIAIGRNIWQHPTPQKMAKALWAIIHENESAASAALLLR